MPAARTTDPQTSHKAASEVVNITATQYGIMLILKYPMSDDRLIDNYYSMAGTGIVPNASPSGIRSRRADLVKAGLVVDTGVREKLVTGRHAIVWQATQNLDDIWPKRYNGNLVWTCCVFSATCQHRKAA